VKGVIPEVMYFEKRHLPITDSRFDLRQLYVRHCLEKAKDKLMFSNAILLLPMFWAAGCIVIAKQNSILVGGEIKSYAHGTTCRVMWNREYDAYDAVSKFSNELDVSLRWMI
jgi:hypothetical protein